MISITVVIAIDIGINRVRVIASHAEIVSRQRWYRRSVYIPREPSIVRATVPSTVGNRHVKVLPAAAFGAIGIVWVIPVGGLFSKILTDLLILFPQRGIARGRYIVHPVEKVLS